MPLTVYPSGCNMSKRFLIGTIFDVWYNIFMCQWYVHKSLRGVAEESI